MLPSSSPSTSMSRFLVCGKQSIPRRSELSFPAIVCFGELSLAAVQHRLSEGIVLCKRVNLRGRKLTLFEYPVKLPVGSWNWICTSSLKIRNESNKRDWNNFFFKFSNLSNLAIFVGYLFWTYLCFGAKTFKRHNS